MSVTARLRFSLILALAVLALVLVSSASAKRAPTPLERQALVGTIAMEYASGTSAWAHAVPIGCIAPRIAVSTVDSHYAIAYQMISDAHACLPYRGNGWNVYKRGTAGWKGVWAGSETPGCSQLPPLVTRDLTGEVCRKTN
jgi:hypothetical protein